MASPMAPQLCSTIPSPSLSSPRWRCCKPGHTTQNLQRRLTRRRLTAAAAAAALTTAFLVKEAFSNNSNNASSFEFRFTVPDQTSEEADAGAKVHARDLLQIKDFIDSKSWKEAQVALRERIFISETRPLRHHSSETRKPEAAATKALLQSL